VKLQKNAPPAHRVNGLKLFPGTVPNPEMNKYDVYKDDFKHMNLLHKDAATFLRNSLDKHLFQLTDRVSLPQFLSLFNVVGPS
jgi:hypothetical protein